MISNQCVVNKETKEILRAGFTDFVNDGTFDPDVEEVILLDSDVVIGPLYREVWRYDEDDGPVYVGPRG